MNWNKYPDVKPKKNGQYLVENGCSMKMYTYWNGDFYSKGLWMLSIYHTDEQRSTYFKSLAKGKVNYWIDIPKIPYIENRSARQRLDYDLDKYCIYLGIRALNALQHFHLCHKNRDPILSLADLIQLTVKDLERTPNIGKKTIHEIRVELYKNHHHLKDDEEFVKMMDRQKELTQCVTK